MSDAFAHRRLAVTLIILGGVVPPAIHYVFGEAAADSAGTLTLRSMPAAEQILAVVAGFVIKPLYMLLSLVAVWLLRRSTTADMVALRWSCVFFFAGEGFCAINYLGFGERSYLMEYLHSYGMVLAFATGAWAMMEFVDRRVIRFSEAGHTCHAASLCGGCVKQNESHTCAALCVMRLALPAMALMAAIPLTSPMRPNAYATTILGARYCYMHEISHQAYEIRVLPIAAVVLLAMAMLALRKGHPFGGTRVLLAAAIGAIGFSWFRWILLAAFAGDQVWFASWEEISELLFMVGVLYVLHVFGSTLPGRSGAAAQPIKGR